MKRRLALVLLFLAVFAPTSLLMGALVPWPTEYGVRSKWTYWEEHKREFNAVFVGSSVTSYGLVPPTFDRVLGERGHEIQSYNLGIGGMTRFEADHMVRAVLEEAPPELRYLFIEVSGWSGRVYGGERAKLSPRLLYWHTPEMTWDAIRACLEAPEPAGKDWRYESAQIHAEVFLDKLTGKGQGPRIAEALFGLGAPERHPSVAQLDEFRGYIDLDHIEGEEWEAWRAEFLGDLEGYTRRVRAIPAQNDQAIPVEGHPAVKWFEKQVRLARAAGVEPIFYFGPYAAPSPLPYRLAEAGILPVFLGFNQPDKYPQLYRFENHFDENHLTRSGAEAFSELIGEGFADHLEGRREE